MKTKTLPGIFSLLFLLISSLVISACSKNPVTGERELSLVSESQEIAMGQQAHPEILDQFGVVNDEALQSYFSNIGHDLAQISHRPDLPWAFTVVDTPVINAFALPGGKIYFTREILAYMNNEAEMAGVLGHEIGHVTARHSVSQMSKAQLLNLGVGLGSIFSPTFRNLSDFAQLGLGLLFLKYGRDDERQSDELGVRYMYQAGYDPTELSDFFQVFQNLREESGESIPNWLSTHPAPPERIQDTAELARSLIAQTGARNLEVGRTDFLRRIDGIVFGENPREGFTEDGVFFHPDLRFRLDYPNQWRVQNTKNALVIVEPNGRAAIQLTLAPSKMAPQTRARDLANQRGVQLLQGESTYVNGIPAFLGVYRLQDPTGNVLDALAAFVDYRGQLYQIVGMAPSQVFRNYSRVMEGSLTSFGELTDRRILNIQPDRLDVYTTRGGETLRQIASRLNNRDLELEELALLNRIDPDERLPQGAWVKVVVPGRR